MFRRRWRLDWRRIGDCSKVGGVGGGGSLSYLRSTEHRRGVRVGSGGVWGAAKILTEANLHNIIPINLDHADHRAISSYH